MRTAPLRLFGSGSCTTRRGSAAASRVQLMSRSVAPGSGRCGGGCSRRPRPATRDRRPCLTLSHIVVQGGAQARAVRRRGVCAERLEQWRTPKLTGSSPSTVDVVAPTMASGRGRRHAAEPPETRHGSACVVVSTTPVGSQMAAALLHHHTAGAVRVASAGSEPARCSPANAGRADRSTRAGPGSQAVTGQDGGHPSMLSVCVRNGDPPRRWVFSVGSTPICASSRAPVSISSALGVRGPGQGILRRQVKSSLRPRVGKMMHG
jgi:hypothetical protein